MDVSSINSDLIRGNVTTIILKSLMAEDRYGYDILREIEVKSGGQYKLKQPTLYSCLKRLEKQGLISSYWGDESDTEGGRRRYYSLTQAGRTYLEKMQAEYEYSRTILDSLLSEEKFDFDKKEAPFDINSLRPYTKRSGDEDTSATPHAAVHEEAVANRLAEDNPAKTMEGVSTPNAPTETASNTTAVTDESQSAPREPIFKPMPREGSSYDTGYRHTARSFKEVFGEIDSILAEKKKEKEEQVAEESKQADEEVDTMARVREIISDDNSPAPKPDETDDELLSEVKISMYTELLKKPREETPPSPPMSDEEERQRRAEAKKALGIGQPKGEQLSLFDDEKKSDFSETEVKKEEKKPELFNHSLKAESQDSTPDAETERKKILIEKSPVPPASTFSFRQDDESVVNYREAFSSLRGHSDTDDNTTSDDDNIDPAFSVMPIGMSDLKTRLFSEGYKLRAYSRENTENYYSLNFIKKNRINRDCYGLMYVLICLEVFIGWLIFRDRFADIAYAAICIAALIIPAVPFVLWTVNPDKRSRASFNFRTSVLNRLMLYLNLLVLVCLIGFFGAGADVSNGQTLIAPILVPALLLLNLPLSSVVYLALYKTKRYHIS